MVNGINLSQACSPAKIYFYISFFAIVVAVFNRVNVISIAMKIFFALIWFFILNWLCEKGYENLSWILVLLPYILIAIIFFKVLGSQNMQRTQNSK
jgi:hypothetical protein